MKHPRLILAALLALLMSALAMAAPAGVAPRVSAAPSAAPVPPEIPVALLVDLSSGQVLFAREAGRRFVPASVTKAMSAFTAFELIRAGKLREEARVLITPELQAKWGRQGSTMFLEAGERPTISKLILGATTVSGNDATAALGTAAAGSLENWAALMNAEAAELGMDESHFTSPNGFPDEGRTFTTAHDLALLARALVTRHPQLYRRYFGQRTFRYRGITQENHDPITGRVAGADGIKTGFTNEAGYTFLGSARRGERRLVLVLAGAPSGAVRDKAARDLMEWGFGRFSSKPLFDKGALVGQARVQDGMADTVMLRAPRAIAATVPRARQARPSLAIQYRGPLMAPVEEGETVAQLRVETLGFQPVLIPLEAAEDVGKANAFFRLINGLAGIVR